MNGLSNQAFPSCRVKVLIWMTSHRGLYLFSVAYQFSPDYMQVNSGVLSFCTAFLSGEPATRLRSQELQQLIAALLEFMAVCKRAIRVHFRLIGEEDQEFHTQLVNGFQSLTAELSHYIPAILSEL